MDEGGFFWFDLADDDDADVVPLIAGTALPDLAWRFGEPSVVAVVFAVIGPTDCDRPEEKPAS